MARILVIIGLVLSTGTALAQQDSAARSPSPWVEGMLGLNSPAGLVGAGFGLPCGPWFTPALAAGYGSPEGGHLSVGAEFRALSARRLDLGGFGYWSYITGRNQGGDAWEEMKVSEGQMIKFGASLAVRSENMWLVFRGGYATYTVQPVKVGPWAGHMGDNEPKTLEGGLLLSLSLRFPLGAGAGK